MQCATRAHGLSMGVLKLTSRSENIRPSPISKRNPPLYQYSNATYVQRTIVPWHPFTLASRLLCTRIPNHGRTTLLQLAGTASTVRPKRSYLFVIGSSSGVRRSFLFAMLPSCEFPDRDPFYDRLGLFQLRQSRSGNCLKAWQRQNGSSSQVVLRDVFRPRFSPDGGTVQGPS